MPKRPRPSRIKREERYAKHQGMKSDRKKRKRDRQAGFKDGLAQAKPGKPGKVGVLVKADGEPEAGPAPVASGAAAPVDFRDLLRKRAAARRARADLWRAGRHSRGKIRLFGYSLCPFAEQARMALTVSRHAYTFTEPSLPYWLVPDDDEQEYDGKEPEAAKGAVDEDALEPESLPPTAAGASPGGTSLQAQIDAYHLEALKLSHGDIILVSSWEIFLYIDCLLQAGSKVLKNRHTGAHRGAPPFFPYTPKDRQQCLKLLRSLHGNLVIAYWDLVESLKSKEEYTRNAGPALEKITLAAADVQRVIAESSTNFAFGLRRPGMLEAWCAPLFNRLRLLGLWKPSDSFASWLDMCGSGSGAGEAVAANAGDKSAFMARLREYHTSGAGKQRPAWVNMKPESVWQ